MALWQGKSKRKITGGRLRPARNKRKSEIGSEPTMTVIGKTRKKEYRTRGGHSKIKVMSSDEINVIDRSNKKAFKTKIITVKENTADSHYVQRNILTKGAVVQTNAGLVRITSRPGQDGVVNGVLESADK